MFLESGIQSACPERKIRLTKTQEKGVIFEETWLVVETREME